MKTRQRRSMEIRRPSSGLGSVEDDLVLARESESSRFRQGMGPKLVYEKLTGSWKVVKIVFKGFSAVIEMERRKTRTRTVSMASIQPFYRHSSDLQHPIEDEFAQICMGRRLWT